MRSRITLLPAQQIIAVDDDETILGAALRAGINLPYSCRAGLCSSCRARIETGAVRYRNGRPPGLMEKEAQEGYALLCQAQAASAELRIRVREIKPAAEVLVRQLPCRIEQRRPLASDVMAVSLRLPANEPFAFRAGQHIDVLLPNGRRASFWIASPPHDTAFIELHVPRRADSGFADQVFAADSLKTLLRIEGPLGQFWFREHSPRPAILVGSGTGYAPLRSMLRHLLEGGDRRPLHLYWRAQTSQELYEDSTLRDWSRRYENFRYTPVVATEPDEHRTDRADPVQDAVLEDYPSLREVDVYVSGPVAMIATIRTDCTLHGLPAEQLFYDSLDLTPNPLASDSLRADR